jgi:hypothetical protein
MGDYMANLLRWLSSLFVFLSLGDREFVQSGDPSNQAYIL